MEHTPVDENNMNRRDESVAQRSDDTLFEFFPTNAEDKPKRKHTRKSNNKVITIIINKVPAKDIDSIK